MQHAFMIVWVAFRAQNFDTERSCDPSLRRWVKRKSIAFILAPIFGEVVMTKTLYMVVEQFKHKDVTAVYRRFRDKGRMAPEGLLYVSSWVDDKLERCYQLMETHDRELLEVWMAKWEDLVDFEVHVVLTSKEAAERIAPRL
jgi:hypothetical protein